MKEWREDCFDDEGDGDLKKEWEDKYKEYLRECTFPVGSCSLDLLIEDDREYLVKRGYVPG
jgi:hypothetical protein